MERKLKSIDIEFNSQDDLLSVDYKISFHHNEMRVEMEKAVNEFYSMVKKILETDRAMLSESKNDLDKEKSSLL